jgi:hypothetical protein
MKPEIAKEIQYHKYAHMKYRRSWENAMTTCQRKHPSKAGQKESNIQPFSDRELFAM